MRAVTLDDQTKAILLAAFHRVPGLRALFLVRDQYGDLQLYAQLPEAIDTDPILEPAFEAFTVAADRIITEVRRPPTLVWYGVIQRQIEGAYQLSL